MKKKIIIDEKQLHMISNHIIESVSHVRLKNSIFKFLNNDYEPSRGVKLMGNEFYSEPLVKKKIDGEEITLKALLKYITHKFNGLTQTELIDSIKGWYYGDYDTETGFRKKF